MFISALLQLCDSWDMLFRQLARFVLEDEDAAKRVWRTPFTLHGNQNYIEIPRGIAVVGTMYGLVMIGNTIQVVQSPPMQSGIFKSSLFFLSFITLSLHSLLNKRENEVVSVVNTILVVYSRCKWSLVKNMCALKRNRGSWRIAHILLQTQTWLSPDPSSWGSMRKDEKPTMVSWEFSMILPRI